MDYCTIPRPAKGEKMSEYGGAGRFPVPRDMTRSEIQTAIARFTDRPRAGVTRVRWHRDSRRHGYLIDQFITEYTKSGRSDEYGGDAVGRIRFACEVLEAVRGRLAKGFPLGIRVLSNEDQ